MTITVLTTYAANAVTATDTTASVSPQPGALLLIVAGKRSGSTQTLQGVTSGFATSGGWTRVDGVEYAGGRFQRVEVWRAVAAASPGSGAVTVQWSGNCSSAIVVIEVTGHGEDPITQSVTMTGTGTTATATLPGVPAADALVLAAIVTTNELDGVTPDPAFVEAADVLNATPNPVRLQVQYLASGADATVDWSDVNGEQWTVIAVEVAAAEAVGETPIQMAASAQAAAHANAALLRQLLLQAQAAGVSAATAGLEALRRLTAQARSDAVAQAALQVARQLAGTAAGAGDATGQLSRELLLSAVAAGDSGMSAELMTDTAIVLSATAAAAGDVEASLQVARLLEARTEAEAMVEAGVAIVRLLTAAGEATSGATASLRRESTARITSMSFSFAKRSIAFELRRRSISFSFATRSVEFTLN